MAEVPGRPGPDEPGPDEPGPDEPGPDGPEEEPHRDDGLDLARTVARSVAGSSPAAKRKRRKPADPAGRGRISGSHPDERDPQLLGLSMDRLVQDHGWETSLRVHGVLARWPELVGAEIAAHCTPESFAEGKLVARTDSTAWATQLRLLAPTVLRRLNEDLGAGTVTTIEVLGPHGPSWKKGRRSVRDGRGPRDTYG